MPIDPTGPTGSSEASSGTGGITTYKTQLQSINDISRYQKRPSSRKRGGKLEFVSNVIARFKEDDNVRVTIYPHEPKKPIATFAGRIIGYCLEKKYGWGMFVLDGSDSTVKKVTIDPQGYKSRKLQLTDTGKGIEVHHIDETPYDTNDRSDAIEPEHVQALVFSIERL